VSNCAGAVAVEPNVPITDEQELKRTGSQALARMTQHDDTQALSRYTVDTFMIMTIQLAAVCAAAQAHLAIAPRTP
jgi:hypothetical protein